MGIDLIKKIFGPNSFGVEVRVDGHLEGEADFFEEPNEPGVFGARVDINDRYKKKGLATKALQKGDEILRKEKPDARRRFNDVNHLSYKKYTDGIKDDQIEYIDENGVVFKP